MKKKLILTVATLFSLCLILCSCDGLFDSSNSSGQTTTDQLQSVETPEYSCEYTKGLGYSVTVTGALKNVSNKKYSYVSITFTLYDADGYNIGTAMDNMNYLDTGESWKYKAQSFQWFDEKPASCKCTDITCF